MSDIPILTAGLAMCDPEKVFKILETFHNEHYSVFPRDRLTERLCNAFHDQFVADNSAPGNAAALRDVVESLCEISPNDEVELSKLSKRLIADDIYGGGLVEKIVRDIAKARAALSEPARNVDKLETKEAALAALKERFPVEENFAGFEMAVEWLLDTQDFCLAWPVSHRFGSSKPKGGAK